RDRQKRQTAIDRPALSSVASVEDGRALRRPSGRAIDGATHRDQGPQDWQRSLRIEASSGSEAPGVAATGRFAACRELARTGIMPTYAAWVTFRLGRRPSIAFRCGTV